MAEDQWVTVAQPIKPLHLSMPSDSVTRIKGEFRLHLRDGMAAGRMVMPFLQMAIGVEPKLPASVVWLALLRPNAAPATPLREVTTPIRAILTHASKRKLCSLPTFEVGRSSPARTEWLTPDEAGRLCASAADHLRPLLAFLLCMGARLSEALILQWSDVDLAHQQALLRNTKAGTHRPVTLCPRAVAALAGVAGRASFVFRTQTGLPHSVKKIQGGGQIKTAWAHAAGKAKVTKPVTPHSCRHTWASWRYAEHKDLMRLKVEGGWHSVSMVERYAHLMPEGMVGEIQKFRGTLLTQKPPQKPKFKLKSTS